MPVIALVSGLSALILYIAYGVFKFGHRRKDMPPGESSGSVTPIPLRAGTYSTI